MCSGRDAMAARGSMAGEGKAREESLPAAPVEIPISHKRADSVRR